MNNFQENMADTAGRTFSERHIEALRQQGGIFVDAVRVTRMPMLVTDATLPCNPIVFANRAFIELSGLPDRRIAWARPPFHERGRNRPRGCAAL